MGLGWATGWEGWLAGLELTAGVGVPNAAGVGGCGILGAVFAGWFGRWPGIAGRIVCA